MTESDIFEPYEKLVEIEICGERREVPENNTLLRCFQFLALEAISMGDFCWNGTCTSCQVWLEITDADGKIHHRPFLACRTIVQEKMRIVRLSDEIKLVS
jgi:predicted molibdopterin-dependent oxidoreductase YjgC